jgi:hypothetical protein
LEVRNGGLAEEMKEEEEKVVLTTGAKNRVYRTLPPLVCRHRLAFTRACLPPSCLRDRIDLFYL